MAPDVPGSRVARRRRKRRRVVVAVAVAASLLVIAAAAAGAAFVVSGNGDDSATTTATRPRPSSTSTTTTATVPVSTTVVPKSTNPVVALAQQYDGGYVGTFTNTTFGTSGQVTLEIRIDPSTGDLSTDAAFDGDLFGGGTKAIRRISGAVRIGDPNAAITTDTEAFGPVTGRVDENLQLVLTADDVPGPRVVSFTLTGGLREDLTGFDATYHVVFADDTAADGTITVACDPTDARANEVTTICALSGGVAPPTP